jgi:AcrR family transcriptional regulator
MQLICKSVISQASQSRVQAKPLDGRPRRPRGNEGMKHRLKRRRPRRTRNSDAKRQALIAAATELFARKGYAATTTSEISARAGCAEGLIHRYFGAKAGLLLAILKTKSVQDEPFPLEKADPERSLGDELRRLVKTQLDRIWEERDFLLVSFSQAFIDPKVRAALDPIRRRREDLVAREIRRRSEGLQIREHDLRTIAQAITALTFTFGFVRPAVLGHKRSYARKQMFDITELMARAVQA